MWHAVVDCYTHCSYDKKIRPLSIKLPDSFARTPFFHLSLYLRLLNSLFLDGVLKHLSNTQKFYALKSPDVPSTTTVMPPSDNGETSGKYLWTQPFLLTC
jgi:hypothetical protein